jgi:ankyrin repeat protein
MEQLYFEVLSLIDQGDLRNVLISASSSGYLEVINFLLDNNVNFEENAPTRAALRNGQTSVVQLLFDRKAFTNPWSPLTEIAIAIKSGYIQVIKLLIDREIYQQFERRIRRLFLQIAVRHGQVEIFRLLSVYQAPFYGALLLKAVSSHVESSIELLELLLSHVSDQTVLNDALLEASDVRVVKYLLDAGAQITKECITQAANNVDVMKLFTDYGYEICDFSI